MVIQNILHGDIKKLKKFKSTLSNTLDIKNTSVIFNHVQNLDNLLVTLNINININHIFAIIVKTIIACYMYTFKILFFSLK